MSTRRGGCRVPGNGADPPAEVIIGLDVGTTGVKAVAFGIGRAMAPVLSLREYPMLARSGEREEQDPAAILSAVGAALRESVAAAAGSEIRGVAAQHGDARR